MSLRDLVTGSDMCTPSDGAGPSNAVGALVNSLLGGASKTQEQLRELPSVHTGLHGPGQGFVTPEAAALAAAAGPSHMRVPGVMQSRMEQPGSGASSLLQHITAGHATPAEWDTIFGAGPSPFPPGMASSHHHRQHQPALIAQPGVAPGPLLESQLHQFLSAVKAGAPAGLALQPLPPAAVAGLSVRDKCRIRDRATILARQVFADRGEAFADTQVNSLLASMHIQPQELPSQLPHAHDAAWHNVWAEGQKQAGGLPRPQGLQGAPLGSELAAAGHQAARAGAPGWDGIWESRPLHRPALSTGWAAEFAAQGLGQAPAQQGTLQGPPAWAQEFQQQQQQQQAGPSGWADEFQQQQQPQAPGQAWAEEFAEGATGQRQREGPPLDAIASTRRMVDVLSRDPDPKMRNSQFLQFVSKMSKGELMFADNKVVARSAQGTEWANELSSQQQTARNPAAWAEEFGRGQAAGPSTAPGSARWADEFASQFARDLDLGKDAELEAAWRQQVAQSDEGASSLKHDAWVEEFKSAGTEEKFEEWERIFGLGQVEDAFGGGAHFSLAAGRAGAKGEYLFTANNPFAGDEQALTKGKDLFRRGVLTEAALALEAEVQAHPKNAEAWRLLGTVHAENDDDQQAIAAMLRALAADPKDLDVLLALGVSHTNELDMGEAMQHLATWLATHPTYGAIAQQAGAPPDSSQALSHVVRMFSAASAQHPQDSELQVALGVLHHLGRQYSAAISSFEAALVLRPDDYSLWNKLGATLANNARSGEAVQAYQRALDLKPNYMRAWTNMGISFTNMGEYERAARFYVRALQLNPASHHVWSYLRTALACAGRSELMAAVDNSDIQTLAGTLPLE